MDLFLRNNLGKIVIVIFLLNCFFLFVPSSSYTCDIIEYDGFPVCMMPSTNYCPTGTYLTEGSTITTYGSFGQNSGLITFTAPEDGFYYYAEYSFDWHLISLDCNNYSNCIDYWFHCELPDFPYALSSGNGCEAFEK